jgi:DNA transformation protein and related proteins
MSGNDFVDHLLDLLSGWRGVSARRMFGGWGLYRAGVMFGLVADEVLYLKVDSGNRKSFADAGMQPFAYQRAGKAAVVMSYWECPPDALDAPDALTAFAREAHQAALRSGSKAIKPRPTKAADAPKPARPRSGSKAAARSPKRRGS